VTVPSTTSPVAMYCAKFAPHNRAYLVYRGGIQCVASPQLRRSVNAGSAALDGQFQVVEFKKRSDGSWELQTRRLGTRAGGSGQGNVGADDCR
jgi:hypothetical protein